MSGREEAGREEAPERRGEETEWLRNAIEIAGRREVKEMEDYMEELRRDETIEVENVEVELVKKLFRELEKLEGDSEMESEKVRETEHEEEKTEEGERKLPLTGDSLSFFCHICYNWRTAEELAEDDDLSFQVSSCSHRFCLSCLLAYLESNILEGKTQIKCCCLANDETVDGFIDEKEVSDSTKLSNKTLRFCHAPFSVSEIEEILNNKPTLKQKYERFKFLKDDPNARECPTCGHLQLHSPTAPNDDIGSMQKEVDDIAKVLASNSPVSSAVLEPPTEKNNHPNAMICVKPECQTAFCFEHSLAHPPSVSCEEYESSISSSLLASKKTILMTTKPCPGCGIYVSKTDGCNHMKCTNCQQCFCWVCGVAVEDAVFPNHFQWWNAMGCANMQMVEDIEPSRKSIIFARVTAIAQTLLLGPISLLSTLVCFLFCFPCLYSYHTHPNRELESQAPPMMPPTTVPLDSSQVSQNVTNSVHHVSGEMSPSTTEAVNKSDDKENSGKRLPFPWSQTIQGCVSGWGFFYLCILIVLPVAATIGVFVVTFWLIYLLVYIVTYPLYYYSKKKRGKTPESFFKIFYFRRQNEAESVTGPQPTAVNTTIVNSKKQSCERDGEVSESSQTGYKAVGNGESTSSSIGTIMSLEEEEELRKLEEGFKSVFPTNEASKTHYSGRFDLTGIITPSDEELQQQQSDDENISNTMGRSSIDSTENINECSFYAVLDQMDSVVV